MQALCQWEAQPDSGHDLLREFLAEQDVPADASTEAEWIVGIYWSRAPQIDKLIASATEHWDFSRISTVERNIMRVAAVELLGGRTPPKVAITEAVDIGREFGGAESPRFINGVLDRVWRSIRATSDEPA